MRRHHERVWSGVATLAVAASAMLLVDAPAAYPDGTLAGAATVRAAGGAADLPSGDSGTTFTLRLPVGASCPGDGSAGYRWQTYMVPGNVNPATLTFGSNGPLPPGTGADFRQPLFASETTSPVTNQFTAAADTPGGPGLIVNIPDLNYAVFGPGIILSGVYNVGVACTLGPADADQMLDFWNVQKTFTAPGGGPSAVDWIAGTVPGTTTTLPSTTTTVAPTTTTSAPTTTTTTVPSTTTTTVAPTTTSAPTTTVPRTTTTIATSPLDLLCRLLRLLTRIPYIGPLFAALATRFGCPGI